MKRNTKAAVCTLLPVALVSAACSTFSARSDSSGISITEVCTLNKTCLTDSYGEYSDWIEIHNSSAETVSLKGFCLSDDKENTEKWGFPDDAVIEAGEYMIVFASKNQSTESEYHTGFGLSKSGDELILSRNGGVVQTMDIPVLGEDKSYGISADGTMKIMTPTPAAPNEEEVPVPIFSEVSGFYNKEFDLSLSSENGCEIYYTTDGSDPTASDTAQCYGEKIKITDRSEEPNIYSSYTEDGTAVSISARTSYKAPTAAVDKCMVVRAAAKDSSGKYSDIVEKSYFITGDGLEEYEDITVISLVTDPENLFDPDRGIYVVGNKWKWSENDVWAEDTDPATMRNFHGRGSEWEREASITILENGISAVEQNMGIRIKGSSTRNNPQKSFNLFARSDYGDTKVEGAVFPENTDWEGTVIDKYDSFSLRASGMNRLRDGIVRELIKERPLSTLDMKPCVLFINGEYWGLYEFTERLSAEYIDSHYGISDKDVAMVKDGEAEEGDEAVCREFLDISAELSQLDMTDNDNYAEACGFVDIESMIEHYATGLYTGIFDWPNYNYAVWKNTGAAIEGNPYSDGKWRFVSYDFDHTMGFTYDIGWKNTKLYTYDMFAHMDKEKGDAPTSLFVALLDNDDFRSKFEKVYKEYADSVMSEAAVNKLLDKYREEYMDEAAASEMRWSEYTYSGTASEKLNGAKEKLEKDVFSNISEYFKYNAEYTLDHMKKYLSVSHSAANEPVYNAESLEILEKYLLGVGKLEKWAEYDLHRDFVIDCFDMIELRKIISDQIKSKPNLIASSSGWKLQKNTESGAAATALNLSGGLYVDVKDGGSSSDDISIVYGGSSLEAEKYSFSFSCRCSAEIDGRVKIVADNGDVLLDEKVQFTTENMPYSYSFSCKKDIASADIIIETGGGEGSYTATVTNGKLICLTN